MIRIVFYSLIEAAMIFSGVVMLVLAIALTLT